MGKFPITYKFLDWVRKTKKILTLKTNKEIEETFKNSPTSLSLELDSFTELQQLFIL